MILRPDPPAEPTYTLILTESELMALGALSFRHENIKGDGQSFAGRLPVALHAEVVKLCDSQPEKDVTLTGVTW